MRLATLTAVLCGCGATQVEAPSFEASPAPVYTQDFTTPESLKEYVFSQGSGWSWGPGGTLVLDTAEGYEPPFRSPHAIAVLAPWTFEDFVLEADVMQTGRQYGHRDLCLFFGFHDPAHFHYIHLATTPDEVAHNVMRVDGGPRRALGPVAPRGVDWGEAEWHHVRLECIDSEIRVFFDREATPTLRAKDESYARGHIGFGSFDDEGQFDNVRIFAPDARRAERVTPFED